MLSLDQSRWAITFVLIVILLSSNAAIIEGRADSCPLTYSGLLTPYQDTIPVRPQIYRQITTGEYMNLIRTADVLQERPLEEAENWITEQARTSPDAGPVEIPVVFHILFSSEKNKVSEKQVFSQLEALNRDFGTPDENILNRHPAMKAEGFFRHLATPGIRFCLATERQGSQEIKGIQYYEVPETSWKTGNDLKSEENSGASPWDTRQYLNIWVASLEKGNGGFAQSPGGPADLDGIVIDARFFGAGETAQYPYDQGKTLTHLIANWLGVPSIWGTGNCSDDGIHDTPLHNDPNFGCPGYKHVSSCLGNPVEMTMNFMDQTDDACMFMFTRGQRNRMHASLMEGGPRHTFTENGGSICTPSTITPDELRVSAGGRDAYMQVVPHPAGNSITVESGQVIAGEFDVEIKNAFGKVVWSGKVIANSRLKIDCATWERGIYIVQSSHFPVQKLTLP